MLSLLKLPLCKPKSKTYKTSRLSFKLVLTRAKKLLSIMIKLLLPLELKLQDSKIKLETLLIKLILLVLESEISKLKLVELGLTSRLLTQRKLSFLRIMLILKTELALKERKTFQFNSLD